MTEEILKSVLKIKRKKNVFINIMMVINDTLPDNTSLKFITHITTIGNGISAAFFF